jgi:putative flavoprotein involved in K+ transport
VISFRENTIRKAGTTDVVVIGAGHAGLAMSYCLSGRSIDHVVLERGELANSWRHERWDSLKLLTPNWQSRLPGYAYEGNDPDGFMSMPEVIDFIQSYSDFCGAPVRTNAEVTSVTRNDDGYRVRSSAGEWQARSVVVASGACNIPSVPNVASALPAGIRSLTPHQYRNPGNLDPGGVLIVGASATGLQLADEIQQAGHDVTIAVGEHVRMPRTYRGRDIQYWLDRSGILDERYDEVDDIVRARRLPSPQLVGSGSRKMLDLNSLSARGVRIAGRLMGINDGSALFSGSLANVCKMADLKMNRMLDAIDLWIASTDRAERDICPERFDDTRVDDSPMLAMNLASGAIRTVIWATGFRPDHRWINVPTFDPRGQIRHDGGIAESAGLYLVGLPVLRRRKSSFIHGVEDDARDLTAHLNRHLDMAARPRLPQHRKSA